MCAVIPFRGELRADAIAVKNGVTELDGLLSRGEALVLVLTEDVLSKELES